MNASADAPAKNRKRDRNAPPSRVRNTGANRRGSRVEPPKSAPPPNQADAATAGAGPQELAVGKKVPPDRQTCGSP